MSPIRYPHEPLGDRQGLKTRRIGPVPTGGWTEPVFIEWELSGQSWTDEHPHAEYVYVLAGHLVIESGGVALDYFPGDLACISSGVAGTYSAPLHARMLSIYGPNPDDKKSLSFGPKAL